MKATAVIPERSFAVLVARSKLLIDAASMADGNDAQNPGGAIDTIDDPVSAHAICESPLKVCMQRFPSGGVDRQSADRGSEGPFHIRRKMPDDLADCRANFRPVAGH
jgi:hypothetical protein